MKTFGFRLWTMWFVLGCLTALQAQDLAAVRSRMQERLPQLDAAKAEGAVGENNRGFVEVRQPTGEAAALVSAENKDREAVYAAIAKQTGATPENVGRARARQIANQSAAGVWLQRENGDWYRK